MPNYQRINELRESLQSYCEHENHEHGEMVDALCKLSYYVDYITDEMTDCLAAEMEIELDNYEQNAEIVEGEEVMTIRTTEFRWKDS